MNWTTGIRWKSRALGVSSWPAFLFITHCAVCAEAVPDSNQPGTATNWERFPAGALVVPCSHTQPGRAASLKLEDHSLVNSRPVFVSYHMRCWKIHDESYWKN